MPPDYAIVVRTPTVDEHLRLRDIAGLSPFPRGAAAAGLPNTIIGVVVERDGAAIGMGRVIGDGGLFFQVVDIAVDPAHRRRGIGHAIMTALMARLAELAPARAYVSLIADGDAHRLYARHGFAPTAPKSIGMARWTGGD